VFEVKEYSSSGPYGIMIPVPVQAVTGSSSFDGYVVFPLGVFPPEKEYTEHKSGYFVTF